MVGLPNPLAMFQHHKETKGPKPPKAPKKARSGDDDDEDGDDKPELLPEVASKFSSSCEIFNVFKVLAAGKGNRHTLAEDVDSDESEDEPSSEPGSSEERSLRHVGSTRTVRPGDALHDDDGEDDDDHHTVVGGEPEMDKEETLRRWQSSFGSSTAELDAQGNRLAGKSLYLEPSAPIWFPLTKQRCKLATFDLEDHQPSDQFPHFVQRARLQIRTRRTNTQSSADQAGPPSPLCQR